jgi:hypothetical protein
VVKAKQDAPLRRPGTTLSTLFVEKRDRPQENRFSSTKAPERLNDLSAENRKGCDIGYAPAIFSCEEADSVDTCTVAALDAITAFAVSKPQLLLAESVGFFGSGCSSGPPVEQITQPTSD